MLIALMLVAAYLIGSIPTAVIAGRLHGGVDVRRRGSGNAGATNTARVLGFTTGLVVAAIDLAKGLVAVLCVSRIATLPASWGPALCGLISAVGHVFPVFAGFRGGKGVATAAGAGIALFPVLAPICMAVFLAAAALSRRVAVGSLSAALSLPLLYLASLLLGAPFQTPKMMFAVGVLVFVVFTHRGNIARLVRGEEKEFNLAKMFRPRT